MRLILTWEEPGGGGGGGGSACRVWGYAEVARGAARRREEQQLARAATGRSHHAGP
jgi:hypothetical protein